MSTLVVEIEVEVDGKRGALAYMEKLAQSVEGYHYPKTLDGQPVDDEMDPINS